MLPVVKRDHAYRYKLDLIFVHQLTSFTILHSIHTDNNLIYTLCPITVSFYFSSNCHTFLTSYIYVSIPTRETSFIRYCHKSISGST